MRTILVVLGAMLLPLCANANRVAILDEGLNPNFNNTSVVSEQSCFSNKTVILDDAGTINVRFQSASLCKNGREQDFQRGSATVPKPYFYQPQASFPLGAKLRHGNDVSSAGWEYSSDPNIAHHMIQIFGIGESASTARDTVTAGGGDNIARALNYLAFINFTGLTAVNISVVTQQRDPVSNQLVTPKLCRDRIGQREVNALLARNIPVVVGLQNYDIPALVTTWPACLKGVIKVGGRNAGRVTGSRGLGIGLNRLDFFADDLVSTNNGRVGSSLAAPRVAKAFALLMKEFPNKSVQDKRNALFIAASRFRNYNSPNHDFDFDKPIVEIDDLQNALNFLGGPKIDDPEPVNETPEVVDVVRIGHAYGNNETSYVTQFDMSDLVTGSASNSSKSLSTPSRETNIRGGRDLLIQVTGLMPSTFNHFSVNVNGGSHFERLDGFSQVESTQSVVIHRRHFSEDFSNRITISPSGVSRDWGIKSVQYSFTPSIELTVGEADTHEYGHSDNDIPRLSGLRATFVLDSLKNGVALSMTAWDIDRTDETALFVNDKFIGNLTKSAGNSAYSKRDTFIVPPSLLRNGVNNIELVQRDAVAGAWSGLEDEKWAVRDILVEKAQGINITPVIMFLLNE